jgi:hypothetical protein
MNELPRCRLCGQEPTHLSGGRVSHICVVSEADWRLLHGPRLAQETLRCLRDIAELMDQCGSFTDSHGEQQDRADDAAAIRAALAALGEG